MVDAQPVLRMEGIEKAYPGVRALKGASLTVRAGEIHAVVGENGAGKSTLMAVASGAEAPDAGVVEIGGAPLRDASPAAARTLGLVIAHQRPALAPDLTVLENMVLDAGEAAPAPGAAGGWCREALAAVRAGAQPQDRVCDLSVAQRQLVELAKAYVARPRVLVLDEPTEPLSEPEIESLFAWALRLASEGVGIVYISHRIPEIRRIADRVTVLRDGAVAGTWPMAEIGDDDIVEQVVGRPVEAAFPSKAAGRAAGDRAVPILELDRFRGAGFADVTLQVAPGEILGLAGVEGNGQRDLLHALAGVHPSRDRVTVGGEPCRLGSVRAARDRGIVYLPADRHADGLFLSLSLRENIALPTLGDRQRALVVDGAAERTAVAAQVRRLDVRAASEESPVATLSGGNQQKVMIAGSLLAAPRLFLVEDPTQGVDVGARVEIYRALRALADDGAAVIVVSSDPVELEGLCDRVAVFARGRVVETLSGEDVSERRIAGAALMAATARDAGAAGPSRRRFLRGDYLPSVVLVVLVLVLGAYAAASNEHYLTEQNLTGMLTLLSALAFLALGQLVVMLAGGFDLSIGPLSGLLVVVGSFFFTAPLGAAQLVGGIAVVVGVALAAGLLNGAMAGPGRISPIVTTLITYIVFQGVSLLLRETPGGLYDIGLTDALLTAVGPVPVTFAAAVALALALEWWLRRTRGGIGVRAVGSDADVARVLGVSPPRVLLLAYVAAALLTLAGAAVIAAQVGIGDPAIGLEYTLLSITAVVLGGASIFGGRGSFVGALLGALLILQITNVGTFLHLDDAWQSWLLGGLTLTGAAAFSRLRRS